MIIKDIVKRAWFEILFFIIFPILMTFHLVQAFFLLIYECFRVYPPEIFNLVKRIVYGNEEENS